MRKVNIKTSRNQTSTILLTPNISEHDSKTFCPLVALSPAFDGLEAFMPSENFRICLKAHADVLK